MKDATHSYTEGPQDSDSVHSMTGKSKPRLVVTCSSQLRKSKKRKLSKVQPEPKTTVGGSQTKRTSKMRKLKAAHHQQHKFAGVCSFVKQAQPCFRGKSAAWRVAFPAEQEQDVRFLKTKQAVAKKALPKTNQMMRRAPLPTITPNNSSDDDDSDDDDSHYQWSTTSKNSYDSSSSDDESYDETEEVGDDKFDADYVEPSTTCTRRGSSSRENQQPRRSLRLKQDKSKKKVVIVDDPPALVIPQHREPLVWNELDHEIAAYCHQMDEWSMQDFCYQLFPVEKGVHFTESGEIRLCSRTFPHGQPHTHSSPKLRHHYYTTKMYADIDDLAYFDQVCHQMAPTMALPTNEMTAA